METNEISEAVLGTKIIVPMLSGKVEIKVPAGIQPDDVLRLKGKGLPVFGANMHGDINIRLQVHVPEKLTVEEKEIYNKLRGASKSGKSWWR